MNDDDRIVKDDALAALLDECEESRKILGPGWNKMWAQWLRWRGVVVLPPEHPLRTGSQGPMWDTFVDALGEALVNTDEAWAEVRGITQERVEAAARAALAVLASPQRPA